MYEPLIDIDEEELKSIYKKLKKLYQNPCK
ncbi:MAG: hypothetical protein KatS3mg091_395 [Patescibacteria group bacterium]|nr:MAG: hypothetical protein KatS3mg090_0746 [Patescibacteria group bacterium]GIW63593.1 MAG: hypothetical protein KatS3mg091_395 [Patescibacteria group bacterium]